MPSGPAAALGSRPSSADSSPLSMRTAVPGRDRDAAGPGFCSEADHQLRRRGALLERLRWWPEADFWIGECPCCHSTLAALNLNEGGVMSPPAESAGPPSSGSEDDENIPPSASVVVPARNPSRSGRRRPRRASVSHPGSIPGTGTDGP